MAKKDIKPNNIFILLIVAFANLINKESANIIEYLIEYNLILKKKLEDGNQRIKFTDQERIRLAKKAKRIPRQKLSKFSSLLTPECLLRWYNRLIAKKYTSKRQITYSERKKIQQYVERLICQFAEENPLWGSGRIQGALKQVGIKRSKTYVYNVMMKNGFTPRPGEKNCNKCWIDFIHRHIKLMTAADFFSAEVLTLKGLVRYLIFFTIDCSTKKVKIVHIGNSYCGEKMEILARTITDPYEGVLKEKKYFFCDKDVLYTKKFRTHH